MSADARVERIARELDPILWERIDQLDKNGADLPQHIVHRAFKSQNRARRIIATDPLTAEHAQLKADVVKEMAHLRNEVIGEKKVLAVERIDALLDRLCGGVNG